MLINYIFPHRCISCSDFVMHDQNICGRCFTAMHFISAPYCDICGAPFEFQIQNRNLCTKCTSHKPKYNLARSLLKYDKMSRYLIYNFKYHDKMIHAKLFAKLLCIKYHKEIHNIDIIVPVPMNKIKRLLRNYNPAQILANEISKITKKPMIAGALIKTRYTKNQTSLSQRERQTNLIDSIAFNKNCSLSKMNILLVDDVKTTGATANICSQILKSHGAKTVKLFTIGAT